MKIGTSYLAGFITTLVMAGVAAFFLLRPGNEEVFVPVSEDAAAVVSRETTKISGTLIVPKALGRVFGGGQGTLRIVVRGGQDGRQGAVVLSEVKNPVFPYSFSASVPKEELRALINKKYGLTLVPAYFVGVASGSGEGVNNTIAKPIVTVLQPIPLPKEGAASGQIPPAIDVGSVPFRFYFPKPATEPCPPSSDLVSGRITVTAEFKKKYVRDKMAFVAIEGSSWGMAGEVEEKRIVHAQFMDFSAGTVSFRVPHRRINYPYIHLFAFRCNSGDELMACIRNTLPILDMSSKSENRFVIWNKNLEIPFCGTKDFDGIIGEPQSYFSAVRASWPEIAESGQGSKP